MSASSVTCPVCGNEVRTNAPGRLTRDIEAAIARIRRDSFSEPDAILQRLVDSPAGERIRMKCGAADLRSVIVDVLSMQQEKR